MSGTWNDALVEQLTIDYAAGLSMSVIAANLGHGITRNAVIGKVHRLGLREKCTDRPKRPVAEAGSSKPRKAAASAPRTARRYLTVGQSIRVPSVSVPAAPVKPLDMPDTAHLGAFAINILVDNACKWPVGDPTSNDFRFCGCKSDSGQPYCSHHARMAYQPSKGARRPTADRFSDDAHYMSAVG